MPSHDDGSTDGLDVSEFDLAASPHSPPQQQKKSDTVQCTKQTLDPDFSDSDEEDTAGIHFQSSHFNGDSSDEEEKAFTQGLTFSEVGQLPQNPSSLKETSELAPTGFGEMLTSSVMHAVSKTIPNLGVMGQSLLSTVVTSGLKQQDSKKQAASQRYEHTYSDDSEDDFEMVSQDDLS
jgi:hypothetical protein